MRFPILAILVLLSAGCSKIPADMPRVYPCKITILNQGVPVSDAEVRLADENETKALWCDGKTNSAGVATIRTVYGYHAVPGVPEGTFRVAVDRPVVLENDDPSIDTSRFDDPKVVEYMKKRNAEIAAKKIVPKILTDLETTTLKIEVNPGTSAEMTIDVADHAASPKAE